MTISERLRYLRKEILQMNQSEMAKSLGMKQTSISRMECTPNAVTEQNIKSICLLHNINEDWLRYGIEPIYAQQSNFSLDTYATNNKATALDIEIVKAYLDLDPSIRKHVLEHFKKYLTLEKDREERTSISESPSSDFEKKYPPLAEDSKSTAG